ncbi:hypothetical protein [Streptomyces sp. CoH17]|uniref:hypothetical protein n=1 Tax=Streptomyces sp. CoH17 TaxID=2992806 RepID=UPI00226DC050|nr:hypothetical protein [Streptomyces sp. CoH17]
MPNAPSKARELLSGTDTSGAYPVEYRFTHGKGGNRHLVVVFSNFGVPDDYGWSNGVLNPVRANILWIRDRFRGMRSYYLCEGMDFSLEQSVIGVISKVMNALELTPDRVTLWGGSKGGSAALYFGLRYGFGNIVSIVPQFLIGTYVKTVHPKVARFMLGEGVPEENVRTVDALLPDLVRSGVGRQANIYLLSSPQDEQYKEQVEPFLGLFQGYDNFNFIYSESPHITRHSDVTRRNVPFLMGLINMLADGLPPRLGMVRNGYEEPQRDTSAIKTYLAATSTERPSSIAMPVVTHPVADSEVPVNGVYFTGSAPGAVRVSLWEHGKFLGSPAVAADGTWSWQRDKPWSKGKHLVKAVAWDPEGRKTKGTVVPFTALAADTAPGAGGAAAPGAAPVDAGSPLGGLPAPMVHSPVAYEQMATPAVRFTGLARGAAQVGFRAGGTLLGGTPVAADGRWAWDPGWPWQEGRHAVEVFAVDAVGNESPATQVPFAVVHAPAGATPYGY